MFFQKEDKKIFFVHIPRTGGRFIKSLFFSNKFKTEFTYSIYKGVENHHLHHSLLKDFEEYNHNPKFTVVRNPYERTRSILSIIKRRNNTDKNLEILLNSLLNKDINNWLRPQSEFIGKDCKIWKYENSFKKNFINWLNNNFNLKLIYKKVKYTVFDYDNYCKLNMNNDIKKLTEKLYIKDIELYETIK
jgi:hypothetical protein